MKRAALVAVALGLVAIGALIFAWTMMTKASALESERAKTAKRLEAICSLVEVQLEDALRSGDEAAEGLAMAAVPYIPLCEPEADDVARGIVLAFAGGTRATLDAAVRAALSELRK